MHSSLFDINALCRQIKSCVRNSSYILLDDRKELLELMEGLLNENYADLEMTRNGHELN
jgi:hypothetical protein